MAVRRDKKTDRWQFQKLVTLPDGSKDRIFGRPERNTKQAAERAEREKIDKIFQEFYDRANGYERQEQEVPTVSGFKETFLTSYVDVHNKKSERATKRYHLKNHIERVLGDKRLDEVDRRGIDAFKADLIEYGLCAKSVNNVLMVLGRMLSYAVELGILDAAPQMKPLKVGQQEFRFLTFEEYEGLVEATATEPDWRAAILLAGSAGLRIGEVRALRWTNWKRDTRRIRIEHSMENDGTLVPTKGFKLRTVPLTAQLHEALVEAEKRSHGPFVVSQRDGSPMRYKLTLPPLDRISQRAGLAEPIRWHALRHTLCSHLAMKGAPVKVIQELAGHQNLETTLRYMHLAEGAKDNAIALLEAA